MGKAITGASNLAFVFVVVSGIYLWWPRSWTWKNLKTIVLFRGGLRGKALEWNWHNVFGFWSAVPLFLLVVSATVISYPWASNLVYSAFGEEVAARGGPRGPGRPGGGPPDGTESVAVSLDHVDALLARAQRHDPDWKTISFRVPADADAPVSFSIDTGMGGEPHKRSTLVLDAATGAVAEHTTFWDGTPGRQARSWLRFIHTGEAGGFWGQTIAGIASAGGVFLVYTGFALAIRRFFAWLRRRRRPPVAMAEHPARKAA